MTNDRTSDDRPHGCPKCKAEPTQFCRAYWGEGSREWECGSFINPPPAPFTGLVQTDDCKRRAELAALTADRDRWRALAGLTMEACKEARVLVAGAKNGLRMDFDHLEATLANVLADPTGKSALEQWRQLEAEVARLTEEVAYPTCSDCHAPLGDNWCADCAGKADREKLSAALAENAQLRRDLEALKTEIQSTCVAARRLAAHVLEWSEKVQKLEAAALAPASAPPAVEPSQPTPERMSPDGASQRPIEPRIRDRHFSAVRSGRGMAPRQQQELDQLEG